MSLEEQAIVLATLWVLPPAYPPYTLTQPTLCLSLCRTRLYGNEWDIGKRVSSRLGAQLFVEPLVYSLQEVYVIAKVPVRSAVSRNSLCNCLRHPFR